jgi:hypothetical protein
MRASAICARTHWPMRYPLFIVTTLFLAGCADLTQPSGAPPAASVGTVAVAQAKPTLPARAEGALKVPSVARPGPAPEPANDGCGAP